MWTEEVTGQFERDTKWYAKKHPDELAAVLRNLERYRKQLSIVGNPALIRAGYIHEEPHGVQAVDQKGGGKALAETRLYVYADMEQKVLYLITIGNKADQSRDVAISSEFAEAIRKQKEMGQP